MKLSAKFKFLLLKSYHAVKCNILQAEEFENHELFSYCVLSGYSEENLNLSVLSLTGVKTPVLIVC